MQLRHLRTFASVASTLNMTRASEQLHLSQSSVTEQIQALEADLGARLFERSRQGLKLTRAGHRLLDYAGDILRLADEARAAVGEASRGLSGRIVTGGLETLCATRLPVLLAEFHRLYPMVELAVKSADSGQLLGGIKSGAIDVCFTFGEPAGGSNIRMEQVAQDGLVVIAPSNQPIASQGAIVPGDVLDQPFLVTEAGCIYRRMFDDMFAGSLPDRPGLAGDFGSMTAIRGMVEAGAGCALVPRSALSGDAGNITVLPLAGKDSVVPVFMTWRRKSVQTPVVKTFLAVARKALGDIIPASDRHQRAIPIPS